MSDDMRSGIPVFRRKRGRDVVFEYFLRGKRRTGKYQKQM
jgi:hypothetical protein